MSLDCVEISLGRVFASGQAYVALSRARSLEGLRVLDFDPMVVRCDPRVLSFYATLQRGRGPSLVRRSHSMVREAWELDRGKAKGLWCRASLALLGAGSRGNKMLAVALGEMHESMTGFLPL